MQRLRLAKDEAADGARRARDRVAAAGGAEDSAQRRRALDPREVHARGTRAAPARTPGAGARSARRRRNGRGRRTSQGRDSPRRARPSRARRGGSRRLRARCRASRSGRPRRRPAPAAATPRPRPRTKLRLTRRRARAAPGCASRCRIALAIIPSVVSIPPKRSTAAFETTSSRARPPAAPARRPRRATSTDRGRATARRPREAARTPRRPASPAAAPAVMSVTAATIASYQPSTSAGSVSARPSACTIDGDRERPATASPQLGTRRAGSIASIRRSVSCVDELWKRSRTASSRKGRANGSRCRACSAPSEREHARAPTTCAVEKRGSSTVNVPGSRITCSARSRLVTYQPRAPAATTPARVARSRPARMRIGVEILEVAAAPSGNASARSRATVRLGLHAPMLRARRVSFRHGGDGNRAPAPDRRRVGGDRRMGRGPIPVRRLARRAGRKGRRRRDTPCDRRGRARDGRAVAGAQARRDPRSRGRRRSAAAPTRRPADLRRGRQADEGRSRGGRRAMSTYTMAAVQART